MRRRARSLAILATAALFVAACGDDVADDPIDDLGDDPATEDAADDDADADMPLYYWAGDGAPGDVEGQGVNDVWWVVAPDGSAIEESVDAATDDGGGRY